MRKLTPVCPLSVLSNWEKQIRDHVVPGKLVAYTYHGANRDVTPTTLAQYDVSVAAPLSKLTPGRPHDVRDCRRGHDEQEVQDVFR
jgi:SNF2 family DNA or RNA helicase